MWRYNLAVLNEVEELYCESKVCSAYSAVLIFTAVCRWVWHRPCNTHTHAYTSFSWTYRSAIKALENFPLCFAYVCVRACEKAQCWLYYSVMVEKMQCIVSPVEKIQHLCAWLPLHLRELSELLLEAVLTFSEGVHVCLWESTLYQKALVRLVCSRFFCVIKLLSV